MLPFANIPETASAYTDVSVLVAAIEEGVYV